MGGGPEKETLVFLHSEDAPRHVLDALEHDFPYLKVITHKLSPKKEGQKSLSTEDVPASVWHQASILVTLFALPEKPDLVPNLKWIQLLSAGINHLIKQPIYTETDIPITTASGIAAGAITEWVIMTTLALSKNYNFMHDNQKQHKWDSSGAGLFRRRDWYGQRIGIAGYGSVGRQGKPVLAYTKYP